MLKKFSYAMVIALALVMAVGSVPAFAGGNESFGQPGDLLLGYVYDLRDAAERDTNTWENFMVVQNTTNAWVAAHLRFRAYVKSIEVWDHIILLSPYDVFWLSLTRKSGGGVQIYSADTHTLLNSGLIKSGTEYVAEFSTSLLASCGYTENLLAETEMGEVEVIGVWQINSASHDLSAVLKDKDLFAEASADVNGDGAVNALDVLRSVWKDANKPAGPTGSRLTGKEVYLVDCPPVLIGSMELGDIVTGQYMLYNLSAMQEFREDKENHRDGNENGVILYPDDLLFGRNYFSYVAGEPAYYYNPDWATTTGPTLRDGDADVALGEEAGCGNLHDFNQAWSMVDVETFFRVDNVWGFFMEGAFNSNIMTDAVLSFPTKYLHYLHYKQAKKCSDLVENDPTDPNQWPFWDGTIGVGTYNDLVTTYRKAIKSEWDKISNGPVLLNVFDIWDTEQNKPQAISGPSPHPLFDVRIPHEVNVLNVVNDIFADIFDGSDEVPFDAGQFKLGGFKFNKQQRIYDGPDLDAEDAAGFVLGATQRIHEMDSSSVFRSTMAPIHWSRENN